MTKRQPRIILFLMGRDKTSTRNVFVPFFTYDCVAVLFAAIAVVVVVQITASSRHCHLPTLYSVTGVHVLFSSPLLVTDSRSRSSRSSTVGLVYFLGSKVE